MLATQSTLGDDVVVPPNQAVTRVLNLYAGIGGNRKLWENVEVTAVEHDPKIAAIYKDLFPNDTVVVADAHQYLLDHFQEYDFIWSSPPCPTHSDIRRMAVHAGYYEPKYPDMTLYQEIILLNNFGRAKFVIENVKPYYTPLITPSVEISRHLFWSNFHISKSKLPNTRKRHNDISMGNEIYGFKLDKYKVNNKRQILRNLVDPELGLHILNAAQGTHYHTKGIELVALDLELL